MKRWLKKGGSGGESEAGVVKELRRQGSADTDTEQQNAPPAPLLSGAGGGIFFFHQLGALQFMQERYDMSDDTVAYVGASAGSLLVVLAACGVSAEETLLAADRLARSHGVFKRPLGVAGIWGAIIRAWLDELLPADALQRCRSRVHLVVTQVPSFRQQYLTDFTSRDDLLDAALASAHVPFLLDWSPIANARGGWFVDGSLQDFILWNNSDLLTCGGAAYILDYSQDEELKTGRLDFMGLRDVEGARALMALGHAHAARNAARIDQHFGDVARRRPCKDGT